MSSKYRADQEIHISGWSCGTEFSLSVVVNFTVHHGSKATMVDPAEEPTVEVDQIRFFFGKDEVRFPSVVEDNFANAPGFKDWLMQEAKDQHEAAMDAKADDRRDELALERE